MDTSVISRGLESIERRQTEILAQQRELADRLMLLEQKGSADPGTGQRFATLGAEVARQFEANAEAFRKHKTLALEVETKSITAAQTGLRGSIAPTPGGDVAAETALLPKLRMAPALGAAALIYPRRSVAITGTGAAAVGENVSRPQSQPIYTSITQPQCIVAGYAELSEAALRTTGELQNVVDLHLQADVFRATDKLLIAGGTNFTGGLLALAVADELPNATPDLLEQFVAIEALKLRAAGYRPDIAIVNPTDWQEVYLRRETGGLYVHSSPLSAAPLNIAGCRVVFSADVAAKTALVADSRYVDFMPAERMRIEMAYTGSQFLTGEITVRAELSGTPVARDLAALVLVSRAAA